jgi:hypothetical protein
MLPALLALVIFLNRVLIFAWAGLDFDPPTYASHIIGIIGIYHHAWLID